VLTSGVCSVLFVHYFVLKPTEFAFDPFEFSVFVGVHAQIGEKQWLSSPSDSKQISFGMVWGDEVIPN